jgi:hypothetical protein
VNKEIDSYNRRLGKHLKVFDRVHYKVINYDRKFHTSHGMHLNTEGKEYVARQLVSFISFNDMKLNNEERAVISLNWDNVKMNDKIVVNGKRTSEDGCKFDENQGALSEEEVKLNEHMVSPIRGKRVRRRLVNMSDDFLW